MKIYFADGVDCRIALQEGASVGDALATAAARLDVKKPHARFLALHAASARNPLCHAIEQALRRWRERAVNF